MPKSRVGKPTPLTLYKYNLLSRSLHHIAQGQKIYPQSSYFPRALKPSGKYECWLQELFLEFPPAIIVYLGTDHNLHLLP